MGIPSCGRSGSPPYRECMEWGFCLSFHGPSPVSPGTRRIGTGGSETTIAGQNAPGKREPTARGLGSPVQRWSDAVIRVVPVVQGTGVIVCPPVTAYRTGSWPMVCFSLSLSWPRRESVFVFLPAREPEEKPGRPVATICPPFPSSGCPRGFPWPAGHNTDFPPSRSAVLGVDAYLVRPPGKGWIATMDRESDACGLRTPFLHFSPPSSGEGTVGHAAERRADGRPHVPTPPDPTVPADGGHSFLVGTSVVLGCPTTHLRRDNQQAACLFPVRQPDTTHLGATGTGVWMDGGSCGRSAIQ